uniref:Fungal lipase-like domain-containing protein n=1 Tax=Panagrolaimus sp. ES5 TaxID=591445 RepID=A0AC34FXY3_9BILA
MTGKNFITFFFISAAFCFGIGDAGFDETYAKQMVNFAAASFIAPQTINNTDFANQCFEKSFPNGQWDKAIHYSVEPCAGYFNDVCQLIITRSVPLKMVVIAFRGTVGKAQMDHEADDSLLEYEDWHYNASFGSVNKYFYAASETLWTNYVENTIKDNKGFKIAFTGHSLGGAIASLTALKARHLDIVDANLMTLYTFGEPRIGDSVFASNYRSLVKESYRIIHNSDLVPHMPLCDGILSDSCGKTPKKPYHQPQEI